MPGDIRAQVAADVQFADVRHVIVGPMQAWKVMLAFSPTSSAGRPRESAASRSGGTSTCGALLRRPPSRQSPPPAEMRALLEGAGFAVRDQHRVRRPVWTWIVSDLITVGTKS